jgi:hypothetical protein
MRVTALLGEFSKLVRDRTTDAQRHGAVRSPGAFSREVDTGSQKNRKIELRF